MTRQTAAQIVLASRPQGKPQPENFRYEEVDLPEPGAGQVLLQTRYLSLDPYMRGRMDDRKSYAPPAAIGGAMPGESVAEVVASNAPELAPGDLVLAQTGWRSHAVLDGAGLTKLSAVHQPISTALGVLGMPGFTAYAGLFNIGKPKPGETVVVAAASGPVGSLVGQLARITGARAIGIAGGADKCAYLRDELGFDAAIDHRAADFPAQLAAVCPNGIDVYFENVGGAVWQAVLPLLNQFARVPVCGLIAQYSGAAPGAENLLPATMRAVLSRSLTLRGFINSEFIAERPAFLEKVGGWISAGKVRYREDVTDGLENAPAAFMGLLEGKNFGKALVRIKG
jgi:NADPH-dependent curcumin reductase CurA